MVETKHKEPKAGMLGLVSAAEIRQANKSLPQKEYKEILREPMPGLVGGCTRMIRVNRTGWEGLGFFESRGSREACWNYCRSKLVADTECPCDELFGRK
jgi:hypothetical protein